MDVAHPRRRLDEEAVLALVADTDRRPVERAQRGEPAVLVLVEGDAEPGSPADRAIWAAVDLGGHPDAIPPRVQPRRDQQAADNRHDGATGRDREQQWVAGAQAAAGRE